MPKKALITGITGQDGAYLAKFLLDKGYEVFGGFRRLSTPNFWRLSYLGISEKISLIPIDMCDLSSLMEAVNFSQPDEIYNLAAQSYVGTSFEEPLSTGDVTGIGTARLLEAVRISKTSPKIYQASTSELFGNNDSGVKTEDSVFSPESPYAVAKLYSYWITKVYRKGYGLFVSNGILFNHESPVRGLEFVTRKVTNAVAKIKLGLQSDVRLGNLDSIRDWGFAGDYVEAMWKIIQQDEPCDLVISTGKGHSVRELVELVFEKAGIDDTNRIVPSPELKRIIDVDVLVGDNTKARNILKWKPRTTFERLIEMMYKEDYRRWRDFLDGKSVVWDAPLYDERLKILKVRYSINV